MYRLRTRHLSCLPHHVKLWRMKTLKLFNRDRVLELARAVHITPRPLVLNTRLRDACAALKLDSSGTRKQMRRRLMLHLGVFNGGNDPDVAVGPGLFGAPANPTAAPFACRRNAQ